MSEALARVRNDFDPGPAVEVDGGPTRDHPAHHRSRRRLAGARLCRRGFLRPARRDRPECAPAPARAASGAISSDRRGVTLRRRARMRPASDACFGGRGSRAVAAGFLAVASASAYEAAGLGEPPRIRLIKSANCCEESRAATGLILAAQSALAKLGYPVKADGVEGTATDQALRDFERAHGLPVTTDVNPHLVKQLTAAARAASR